MKTNISVILSLSAFLGICASVLAMPIIKFVTKKLESIFKNLTAQPKHSLLKALGWLAVELVVVATIFIIVIYIANLWGEYL